MRNSEETTVIWDVLHRFSYVVITIEKRAKASEGQVLYIMTFGYIFKQAVRLAGRSQIKTRV